MFFPVTMKQIRDTFHIQFRVGERCIDQGPRFCDYGIRLMAALCPGYDPGKDVKGITENIRHFLRFSCIDGNPVKVFLRTGTGMSKTRPDAQPGKNRTGKRTGQGQPPVMKTLIPRPVIMQRSRRVIPYPAR